MKRQAVSIFLLAALLAATACGEGSGAPASGDTTAADTATVPTETTAYLDTLPKTDMGGRSFVMLIEDRGSNGISNTHIGSETGEVMNDAVFRRDIPEHRIFGIICPDIAVGRSAVPQMHHQLFRAQRRRHPRVYAKRFARTLYLAQRNTLSDALFHVHDRNIHIHCQYIVQHLIPGFIPRAVHHEFEAVAVQQRRGFSYKRSVASVFHGAQAAGRAKDFYHTSTFVKNVPFPLRRTVRMS